MNLVNFITDALWEGFEAEDNACVDRSLDLIDTGGTYETFSMERVAQHLIDHLGLGVETRFLEDGWGGVINPTDGPPRFVGQAPTRVSRPVGRWVKES